MKQINQNGMEREKLFSELSKYCNKIEDNNLDPQNVWTSIFTIAQNDTVHLPVLNSLIQQFILNSNYKVDETPIIKESLLQLFDPEFDFQKRLSLLVPIVNILQFLPNPTVKPIFDAISNLIKIQLNNTSDVPENILNIVETIDTSSLNPQVLEILENSLLENQSESFLLTYAPILSDLIDDNEDLLTELVQTIHKFIQGDTNQQISSLVTLRYIAPQISGNKRVIPSDMFTLLSSHFLDQNEVICFRAHKAMRRLIECGVFDDKQEVAFVIGQFPKYPESKYPLFFKLLQRFLDDYQNPKINVVQAIYNFIESSFDGNSDFIKGRCLELLSQIAAINKIYVEDIYEEAFGIALELLKTEKRCYTEITNFFLAVSKLFPETTLNQIIANLPTLTDSLEDEETGTTKQRMERAESIATIIQSGSWPEMTSKVTSFALKTLDTIVGNELFYVCSVIIALIDQLNGQTATVIFEKLEKLARKATVSPKLNVILHTMKKLMKKFNIDSTEFVNSIMKGDINYLGNFPLYTCQDDKTMIFYFIAAYIRQYPLQSDEICRQLIDIIPQIRCEMTPVVLEPIEAGIHCGVITFDSMTKLYKYIMEILTSFDVTENVEEICSCIEILSQIGKSNPGIFDIPKVFSILKQLILSTDEEELDNSQIISKIIRLILELYTIKVINIDIDEKLFDLVLKILPLSPEIEGMDDILELLVVALDDVRFKKFVAQILILFAEMLMMKKADLDEYELDAALIAKMKGALKKAVREDKTLERQITKSFRNQRQKMNRFNAILK
ncbi:hypothetical protein GPJ56_003561 [Histomonas meleagridis]|uniref:uncharacterized protein n=1 Tax=Histomonas meleagridis TaxID=135588 RepID=UPI003559D085|nr:hypothetical protein GPJ56_003561 [Histomonas meleagridis]KAH0800631.1 hypothetical protein GO595_006384 [Histomonas meleagridis]